MLAPIALFVYNRPDHTKKTVEALAKNTLAQESELYVFADGAKDEKVANQVREVRDFLKTISGFKAVHIRESEKNKGLAQSIIGGVSEIVQKYGKIIVVEDDLVSSPHFLQYMNEALNKYENNDKVISIHGYLYPIKGNVPETFFIKNPSCWGWATWKRGWSFFNTDAKNLLHQIKEKGLIHEFDFNGTYKFSETLRRVAAGTKDSWAVRWYASAFLANKLTLYPGRSLVTNIGFDGTGKHGGDTNVFSTALSTTPIQLRDIPVEENAEIRKKWITYFSSLRASIATRLKWKLANLGIKVYRKLSIFAKRCSAPLSKVHFLAPNYLFRGNFGPKSTIIDVGCGFDADFSVAMIKKYGLTSIGVDPTLKHQGSLAKLVQTSNGCFKHEAFAITAQDGSITFNESEENVSGSVLSEHKNVQKDTIRSYTVESVSLASLPRRLKLPKIEYIKLDLEGAEYELFRNISKQTLDNYQQIFVEFHHHCVPTFSRTDTLKCVKNIENCDFKSFTLDNHNFLFYRP